MVITKAEKVKSTIYAPKELKDWYEEHSVKTGLTQNALYILALKRYRESEEKKNGR
jgi:hypothetical protein